MYCTCKRARVWYVALIDLYHSVSCHVLWACLKHAQSRNCLLAYDTEVEFTYKVKVPIMSELVRQEVVQCLLVMRLSCKASSIISMAGKWCHSFAALHFNPSYPPTPLQASYAELTAAHSVLTIRQRWSLTVPLCKFFL